MQQPAKNSGISSYFGPRGAKLHAGIDYTAPSGTKVVASDKGTVVRASYNPEYGNVVVLNHGLIDGHHTYTLYAHLADGSMNVKPGQTVNAGDPIGSIGNTGHVYGKGIITGKGGEHLHFEVIQAPLELPWRQTGPMGVSGSAYRIDPEKYVDKTGTATPADSSHNFPLGRKIDFKPASVLDKATQQRLKSLSQGITIANGETLRREGDKVWRVERDGSTRGYFISP